jgi:hypothetical protein
MVQGDKQHGNGSEALEVGAEFGGGERPATLLVRR